MRKNWSVLQFFVRLFVFLAFNISFKTYSMVDPTHWLCRNGHEVRTIRIQNKTENCLAWYAKEGLDTKVAQSKSPAWCDSIVQKIKGTLVTAGWKCKDISSSTFSQ